MARNLSPIAPNAFPPHTAQQGSQLRVLLLEGISSLAADKLREQGYQVKSLPGALSGEELIKEISNVHVIGIRSKTTLTREVLECAPKLLLIGAFCIGTNQIDLKAAMELGVVVFNSPFQNSRSVAELVIGMIITLARKMGDTNMAMHNGRWAKSSTGCFEVRGKILGIVGYGHVGSQLSVLAEAMGLNVCYYDTQMVMPIGNATKLNSLEELLRTSDFVSLHVPLTHDTANMIGSEQISMMKKGSYLLNASRGTVVDIPSAVAALKAGHLAGSYFDVYPQEPESSSADFQTELQGCPNTILSPHIGGSTKEAQEAIAQEVTIRFIEYLNAGTTMGAVNFPEILLPYGGDKTHRILYVHRNIPGVMKEVNRILADYNVASQFLRTLDSIGYFVADVEASVSKEIKRKIQEGYHVPTWSSDSRGIHCPPMNRASDLLNRVTNLRNTYRTLLSRDPAMASADGPTDISTVLPRYQPPASLADRVKFDATGKPVWDISALRQALPYYRPTLDAIETFYNESAAIPNDIQVGLSPELHAAVKAKMRELDAASEHAAKVTERFANEVRAQIEDVQMRKKFLLEIKIMDLMKEHPEWAARARAQLDAHTWEYPPESTEIDV